MTQAAAVDQRDSFANREKIVQLERALDAVFGEALRKGWYGRVRLEMPVQDGTVQGFELKAEKIYR